MREKTTQGVQISVVPMYVAARSNPSIGHYLFAYQVTIRNQSEGPVKLLTRHWIIEDAMGQTQEVRGAGVVGKQPRLEAGEAFEYVSFCPLSTATGEMRGSYQMICDDGRRFDAVIPTFELLAPNTLQ